MTLGPSFTHMCKQRALGDLHVRRMWRRLNHDKDPAPETYVSLSIPLMMRMTNTENFC